MGDSGGGHWLVRMEWRPAGQSVCLPLLIFCCTIKSRGSLLALDHLGGPGKRVVKRLWCGGLPVKQILKLAIIWQRFIGLHKGVPESVHLHYTTHLQKLHSQISCHKRTPLSPVKNMGDLSPVFPGGQLWLKHSLVNTTFYWNQLHEFEWMRICSYNAESIYRLQQISTKIVVIALY